MAPKTLKQTQTAKAWAECWAEPVSTASASTRAEFLKQYGVMEQRTVSACPTLNLGTDCAGAEAPVWALKALGVPFRHQWAAEIAPHARKFISVTCGLPQCRLLGDMCARDHSVLEPIDLYVRGFPCKPWSRLNNRSLFWDDPNARPFKAGYHFEIPCLCQCQSCYTSHHVFWPGHAGDGQCQAARSRYLRECLGHPALHGRHSVSDAGGPQGAPHLLGHSLPNNVWTCGAPVPDLFRGSPQGRECHKGPAPALLHGEPHPAVSPQGPSGSYRGPAASKVSSMGGQVSQGFGTKATSQDAEAGQGQKAEGAQVDVAAQGHFERLDRQPT